MQLDVREIINIPGAKALFDYEPDLSGMETGAVSAVLPGARAFGVVENRAGVLHLDGTLEVSVVYECSRCLKTEERSLSLELRAVFTDEEDSDEPDAFSLDGNLADIDEIVADAFILHSEERYLCREDCRGLCPRCGADLNEGPCGCGKEIDPRLAVLRQLLETE